MGGRYIRECPWAARRSELADSRYAQLTHKSPRESDADCLVREANKARPRPLRARTNRLCRSTQGNPHLSRTSVRDVVESRSGLRMNENDILRKLAESRRTKVKVCFLRPRRVCIICT